MTLRSFYLTESYVSFASCTSLFSSYYTLSFSMLITSKLLICHNTSIISKCLKQKINKVIFSFLSFDCLAKSPFRFLQQLLSGNNFTRRYVNLFFTLFRKAVTKCPFSLLRLSFQNLSRSWIKSNIVLSGNLKRLRNSARSYSLSLIRSIQAYFLGHIYQQFQEKQLLLSMITTFLAFKISQKLIFHLQKSFTIFFLRKNLINSQIRLQASVRYLVSKFQFIICLIFLLLSKNIECQNGGIFNYYMKRIPFDLVVARSLNRGIGKNNALPWVLSPDLKMFKKITTSSPHGNTIIMGRKTYESIGKPLPSRLNIVISKNSKIAQTDELKQARSLDEALSLSQSLRPKGKAFVIGGQKVYEDSLADCRYIYETLINKEVQCDKFLPQHNLPCKFVSKTLKHQNIVYDHRAYLNEKKYQRDQELQRIMGVPEHEQYQYIDLIKKIIENGQDKIDRTKTGTRSLFGGMMRYDLKESFPLLTHKRVFWRGVAEELLWFVSGSTNAKQLQAKKIHIWDGNSSKEYLNSIGIDREAGDLGPVYGFQWRHWNAPYTTFHQDYTNKGIDQLAWLINEIKTNPSSRRLIMSAWNPGQLKEMALPPCHLLSQFHVSKGRLNCLLYQRSCDMGLGVPFNIASYSLLTCLIAQVTGLERGEFVHMMADLHVYNDHIESLRGLDELAPYPFPQLEIDPSIKNIDDFRMEHLKIKGYKSHPKIPMKMSV